MDKESKPEKKKLPMKTRLIIIVVTFVIVNLIFYVVFDGTDDSSEKEEIEQENEVPEQPIEEQEYYQFNPPKPGT